MNRRRAGSITKTSDSEIIVYKTGRKLQKLDGKTGKITTIYEDEDGFNVGSPSIAHNRRYVAFSPQ